MSKILFVSITREELYPLIKLAFQDDEDLLEKYSLLNKPTLQQSVDTNYSTIIEAMDSDVYFKGSDIRLFRLDLKEGSDIRPIGFTVTVKNDGDLHELYSFGINIRYRSCKVNANWLQGVKDILGKYFYVALHKNNERAIGYFVKNGFTKKTNGPQDIVYLYSNHNEFIKQRDKKLLAYGS